MPVLLANRGIEWYRNRGIRVHGDFEERQYGEFDNIEEFVEAIELDNQFLQEDIETLRRDLDRAHITIEEYTNGIQSQTATTASSFIQNERQEI